VAESKLGIVLSPRQQQRFLISGAKTNMAEPLQRGCCFYSLWQVSVWATINPI